MVFIRFCSCHTISGVIQLALQLGLRKLCSVLAALFYSEFPPKYCIMLTLFLHYAQNCFDYAHSVLRNTEQLAISVFLFVIFGACAICQRDYPALLPDFARDV